MAKHAAMDGVDGDSNLTTQNSGLVRGLPIL